MRGWLRIAAGVVGAVAGFIATLLLLELGGFGNRADLITSGLLALFGAIAGLVLATRLATRVDGSAGSLARGPRTRAPERHAGTRGDARDRRA